MTIKPGEPYRAETVAETTTRASPTASAPSATPSRASSARPEIDRATGQVAVALAADPQRRVYVRRINVAGNTRTRDEVVRREFRQFESSWYDGSKIKLSRDRVDRLGYFSEVNVETSEVPGAPDQVDLTINVKEKPTGNLLLGAGFSSAEKLVADGVDQAGQRLRLGQLPRARGQHQQVQPHAGAQHGRPVLHDRRHLARLRRLLPHHRPLNSQGEDYQLVTPGASVRFGVPFTEYDTVFFGIGVERTEIKRHHRRCRTTYFLYREQFGATSNVGAAHARLDARRARQRAGAQRRPLPARQPRVERRRRRALPAHQPAVPAVLPAHAGSSPSAFNAEIGYGKGLGGQPYPVFKNFYGGGLGTVRAFEQGSLGPVDVTGAYIGGNRAAQPQQRAVLAGARHRQRPHAAHVRLSSTPATCGARTRSVDFDSLRASAGIGLSWISPVGPLKLSYGTPIRKQPER